MFWSVCWVFWCCLSMVGGIFWILEIVYDWFVMIFVGFVLKIGLGLIWWCWLIWLLVLSFRLICLKCWSLDLSVLVLDRMFMLLVLVVVGVLNLFFSWYVSWVLGFVVVVCIVMCVIFWSWIGFDWLSCCLGRGGFLVVVFVFLLIFWLMVLLLCLSWVLLSFVWMSCSRRSSRVLVRLLRILRRDLLMLVLSLLLCVN